jgi:PAS domain S-box-containing protein
MSELENKLHTELDERLRFEALLIDISTHFINLPAEHIDQSINFAQQSICECFGIDRSTIWQRPIQEPDRCLLTHIYQSDGSLPPFQPEHPLFPARSELQVQSAVLPPYYRSVDAKTEFPWIFSQVIECGKTVLFTKFDDLPPEARHDVENLKHYGTKADVIIPLVVGGSVMGCITFAMIRETREWPQVMVQQLNLIAQIFANALSRKVSEKELRTSETRLSLAADFAEIGLWSLEIPSGKILCSEKVRELFGFRPDEDINLQSFLSTVHSDDREQVSRAIQQSLRDGTHFQHEYRIVLPNGGIRWINSRGRLNATTPGEPRQLMGVSLDITDRKESERRLQNSYMEIKELKERLEAENIYLRNEVYAGDIYKNIIGQSEPLMRILHQVEQVAATDSTVLLSGETGSGKELIAQAIHDLSKRKDRILVKVNCAALPATLIESELFGREKGAYTGALARQIGRFELAHHSTLLLDEITELPLELQAKLLRVLENGELERLGSSKTIKVNVRIIAATNRDIATAVRKGNFREDLYYRLNVFPIEVPPLRKRIEDIPLLVEAFVSEFSAKMGKKIQTIPKKTMEALQRYHWPGNIRELRNVIEQAVILSSGGSLQVLMPQKPDEASFTNQTLEEAEYQRIIEVLTKTGWRVKGPNGAAELLGLKPSTLSSKMKKLGIPNLRKKHDISF